MEVYRVIPIRLIDNTSIEDLARARELISLDPTIYLPYNTPEDIFVMLTSGTLQMWTLGTEGGVLTRTDVYEKAPGGPLKVLRVLYAMGKMSDLIGSVRFFMEQIEAVARANGTQHIRVECGRIGWSRLLPGYETEQVTFGKKL